MRGNWGALLRNYALEVPCCRQISTGEKGIVDVLSGLAKISCLLSVKLLSGINEGRTHIIRGILGVS
jgi:hypothetical protein